MDSPYVGELTAALSALRAAARLSQSMVSSTDKGAIAKADLSPVTVADLAVQALLVASLQAAFPDDVFVGEEDASGLRENPALLERVWELLQSLAPPAGANDDDGDDKSGHPGWRVPGSREQLCELVDQAGRSSPGGPGSGRVWVLDPIDGTKTYMRGELYAINLALLVDGTQTLGAVACPNMALDAAAPLANQDVDPAGRGCLVYAVRGHGAYAELLVADARPRSLSRRLPRSLAAAPADGIRLVTSASMADSDLEGVHQAVAERLQACHPGCDLLPWVLRWTALAMGLGNTTVWVYRRRDRFAKAWDHAGAMLLFEETGGKITDVHGRPIDLSAGRILDANFGFVAASEGAHARVLAAVQEVLRERGHGHLLS